SGKSIDTASGRQGTNQPQAHYHLRAGRGLSAFDVRQRFVFSSAWELPLGTGRRWLKAGRAAQALGQRQAAAILTFQTGQPLTAVLPTALSGTQSSGTDRPVLIVNPELPTNQRNHKHTFDTATFKPPAVFFDSQGPFS